MPSATLRDQRLHDRRLGGDRWPSARCGPPSISATTASTRFLVEVDGGDARAGRGEGQRDLAADAAGRRR